MLADRGIVVRDHQRRAARIHLPRHAARRIALAIGAQPRPLLLTDDSDAPFAGSLLAARRGPRTIPMGSGIDEGLERQMQPGPGAKQPERRSCRELESLDALAATM